MIEVSIIETIDVKKQFPKSSSKSSSKFIYICKGTRGGLYQLIEFKRGKKRLYSVNNLREIKDFKVVV